ncbi:MAG: hypothetical protein AMJ64_14075 [Betaproteobacteria bacterium SG8_39]|nr:MAG: hypothetical protein AMJ64_14075 [Betaproteobacteria bacterium SG8_39]
MNALQHRTEFVRLESDLAARLDTLFRRCPALHGFSVQPGSSVSRERAVAGLQDGLYLADVVSHWPLSDAQAATLVDEISLALLELVDEQPEASALLRGRTFARILH